jgi:hypothetical protein
MTHQTNYAGYIEQFLATQKRIYDAFSQQIPYESKMVAEYAAALFTFCPFKVGDTATIVKPLEISASVNWGYLGAKHLFVMGQRVEIVGIDYFDTYDFCAYFKFECETWLSSVLKEEVEYLDSERSIYRLNIEHLSKNP